MSTILDEIIAYKRHLVAENTERVPLAVLEEQCEGVDAPPSLFEALIDGDDIAVIAEVKKASPSKGVIREDFDPVWIAKTYEDNGASAVSVLTDVKYFQGSDGYLSEVSKAVYVPVLRKDFIIDSYQVYEAKAIGASAVLLIVSALSPAELSDLIGLCQGLMLDALVEVHTQDEVLIAIDTGAEIVGVNNRDLRTFETDLQTTFGLMNSIPDDRVIVSESGINNREEIERLRDAGVDAVLVGERLMREVDIGRSLRELLGR
jgi:indole-3-glycerol phosphate synthase